MESNTNITHSQLEEIVRQVKERELRIGISVSLTQLSKFKGANLIIHNNNNINKIDSNKDNSDDDDSKSNECTVVNTHKPVVMMKTLYSDFIVREMCAFHNDGKPLSLIVENKCQQSLLHFNNAENNRKKRMRSDSRDECYNDSNIDDHLNNNEVYQGKKNICNNEKDHEAYQAENEQVEQSTYDDNFTARVKETLSPLLSTADLERLVRFVTAKRALATEHKRTKSEMKIALPDTVMLDKTTRTQLHGAIKSCMNREFISSTENGIVYVAVANAALRREEERRSRPLRLRDFTHFTLYKENLDSAQVFRSLARMLHVRVRQFSYCGTKDKRAITLQRVAIQDTPSSRLSFVINAQSISPQGKVHVCDFTTRPSGLRLGDAMGNHFTIVLRCLPHLNGVLNTEELERTETVLTTNGVINYYGPQRFGTTSILTSDIGVALLRGEYCKALQFMFASRAYIVPAMEQVVRMISEKDYANALSHTPHYCLQERDMLRHLVEAPNDLQGAFRVLPRTLAMLYFHAVQSLIWNTIASQRMRFDNYNKNNNNSNNNNLAKENARHKSNHYNTPIVDANEKTFANTDREQETNNLRTCVEVGDLVLSSVYDRRVRESKDSQNGKSNVLVHEVEKECKMLLHNDTSNTCAEEPLTLESEWGTEIECPEDDNESNKDNNNSCKKKNNNNGVDVEDKSKDCKLPAVHCLSKDDDLSLFDLTDVVLPLPGPDVDLCYPQSNGSTYEDYQIIMRELGVLDGLLNISKNDNHTESFIEALSEEADDNDSSSKKKNSEKWNQANNSLVKTFHFHGAYRPLCVRPHGLQIYSKTVNGWRTPVSHSDLELLYAKTDNTTNEFVNDQNDEVACNSTKTTKTKSDCNSNVSSGDADVNTNTTVCHKGDGSNLNSNNIINNDNKMLSSEEVNVIVCNFSLPSGSYATSVLREVAIVCPDNQHNVIGGEVHANTVCC